ncbi:hypothetical protein FKP32DRAFT_1758193 [Trametes sanguinea]|nr:hypothetical protein FKP32DRAFT_1758193 [Trametes sanguinea]
MPRLTALGRLQTPFQQLFFHVEPCNMPSLATRRQMLLRREVEGMYIALWLPPSWVLSPRPRFGPHVTIIIPITISADPSTLPSMTKDSPHKDTSGVAVKIAKPILDVLEPALSLVPVPGLNFIPKALSVILDQVERARVNEAAVERFKTQAKALGDAIARVANPTDEIAKQSATDDDYMRKATERVKQSEALKQGVQELNQTMEILKQRASALGSSECDEDCFHTSISFIKRTFSASKDADIITGMQSELATAVKAFQIHAMAAINEGVQEVRGLLKRAEEDRILRELCPVHATYRSVSEPKTQLMEGTRELLLQEIEQWSTGRLPNAEDPRPVYLLSGGAGVGKSAVAYASCKRLDAVDTPTNACTQRLGASAFFDHTTGQLTAQLLFPTLARQLAESQPILRDRIILAIRAYLQKGPSQSPQVSFQELLLDPLGSAAADVPSGFRLVIVVDGLDECADQEALHICLDLLLDLVRRFRWIYLFVASRPVRRIMNILTREDVGSIVHHYQLIRDVDDEGDVAKFLRATVPKIPAYGSFLDVRPQFLEELVVRAGGLFIFARTAVNVLDSDFYCDEPEEGFRIVLSHEVGLDQMDALCLTILRTAFPPDDLDRSPPLHARLLSFLHTVTLMEDAYPLDVVTAFTNAMYDQDLIQERIRGKVDGQKKALTQDEVLRLVHRLGSVVYVEPYTHKLRPIHISFYEFLLDRCKDPHYRLNRGAGHAGIAIACLSLTSVIAVKEYLLGRRLGQDSMRDGRPSSGTLAQVACYGARHATVHLQEASLTEELRRTVAASMENSYIPCRSRLLWISRDPTLVLTRPVHCLLRLFSSCIRVDRTPATTEVINQSVLKRNSTVLSLCSNICDLPPEYAEGFLIYCSVHLSKMLSMQMLGASQEQVYSAVRLFLESQEQEPADRRLETGYAAQDAEVAVGDAGAGRGPQSWVRFIPQYEKSWKSVWEALDEDPELKGLWYDPETWRRSWPRRPC